MTLRQLVWMRDAKQRDQWNHTSMLAAVIANTVRDSSKRAKPFDIQDFHPFQRSQTTGKRKKTAAQLLAKLAAFDGQQPQTVTEKTWTQKMSSNHQSKS